jgi:hypothetical protein
MHPLTHVSPLVVLLILRELPHWVGPAYVTRRGPVTVLFTDPRAKVEESLLWAQQRLTVEERNYLRDACGEPPVGQPLSERSMNSSSWGDTPLALLAHAEQSLSA